VFAVMSENGTELTARVPIRRNHLNFRVVLE